MKETVWKEQYQLGIEELDHAHQRILSNLCRLILLKDYQREGQFAYQEDLKYLKSYTLKHFAAEERYMQHMNYEGYERHKRLHEYMRDTAIPSLEKEIEDSGYKAEWVKYLLGFSLGWLVGHIFMEDRAIAGKWDGLPVWGQNENQGIAYGKAVGHAMSELFGHTVQLADTLDSGEELANALYCRLCYRSQHGERVQAFFGIEKEGILQIFLNMLNLPFPSVDQTVRCAFIQLIKQLLAATAVKKEYLTQYRLEKEEYVTYEQLLKKFEKGFVQYRLCYDTCYGKTVLYILN